MIFFVKATLKAAKLGVRKVIESHGWSSNFPPQSNLEHKVDFLLLSLFRKTA